MEHLTTIKDSEPCIYTDGSCHTQLLVGAWVAIIQADNQKVVLWGTESDTSHHRMEITAVIKAILHLKQNHPQKTKYHLTTDSQYVIGLFEREEKLKAHQFKTRKGQDIRNLDLVKKFYDLKEGISLIYCKIKAHQSDTSVPENKAADELSRGLVRKLVAAIPKK